MSQQAVWMRRAMKKGCFSQNTGFVFTYSKSYIEIVENSYGDSTASIYLQGTYLCFIFPNHLCRTVAFRVLYLQTLKTFENILY